MVGTCACTVLLPGGPSTRRSVQLTPEFSPALVLCQSGVLGEPHSSSLSSHPRAFSKLKFSVLTRAELSICAVVVLTNNGFRFLPSV